MSAETFRNELAARLLSTLPQDQVQAVLATLDKTLQDYDVSRKPVTLITQNGLRGGMPLDRLQALMGHAKPETTLIYAKLDQTDLRMEHSRVYS